VLKGHETCISDGNSHYRNHTGNPGMAVGGSGDVLAGMITGLLARGLTPFEAACCAVWVHGSAGDLAQKDGAWFSVSASSVLAHLPAAFGLVAPTLRHS